MTSALIFNWRAVELCWGLWLTSLLSGWIFTIYSTTKTLSSEEFHKTLDEEVEEASLSKKSSIILCLVFVALALFCFTFFHGIHSMFLSLFFPLEQLGIEQKINGYLDLISVLLPLFWPVLLSTLIQGFPEAEINIKKGGMESLFGKDIFKPMMRIHGFLLLFFGIHFALAQLPAIAEQIAIILILFFFYFPLESFRKKEKIT